VRARCLSDGGSGHHDAHALGGDLVGDGALDASGNGVNKHRSSGGGVAINAWSRATATKAVPKLAPLGVAWVTSVSRPAATRSALAGVGNMGGDSGEICDVTMSAGSGVRNMGGVVTIMGPGDGRGGLPAGGSLMGWQPPGRPTQSHHPRLEWPSPPSELPWQQQHRDGCRRRQRPFGHNQ
jgi:hypothetical protein